jgi:lysophospholipase
MYHSSYQGYSSLHRSLLWSTDDKGRTGLDTSLTDIWARALSYHFLTGLGNPITSDTITTTGNFFTNDTSHGAGILWSDMASLPTFQKREFPLPLVVADVRPPGFSKLPPNTTLFLNSTQYEFTPWELGSYDPDLSAFVDIRFLGTHLINGKPANSSACVTQFDQTSFVFGTSSSLFNVRICASVPYV